MTSNLSWLSARWWIFAIAGALCVAGWNHTASISHATYVSDLAGGSDIAIDAESPTGYESGFRKLVVPERNAASFQWIMQVQEMFENGSLLLKHVDYDNAPDGRSVRTSSLYRWWLGGVAWVDHMISGNPIGVSVERAALAADPIAQMLFLLLTAIFISRYFSGGSAALFSIGFVSIFPLGTAFASGQPGDSTFILMCSIWSVLPLVAGISNSMSEPSDVANKSLRKLFLTGGFIGGIGMWIGVSGILPLLIGIVIAGGSVDFLNRRKSTSGSPSAPLPWRLWAIAGASATLVAWLIDRSPLFFEAVSWQSDFVHPLYALAWLGAGEILESLNLRGKTVSKRKKIILSIAGLAIIGLAYTIIFHGSVEGWSIDPVSTQLTRLPIDPGATSIGNWKAQGGGGAMLLATLIPAGLLVVGIFALMHLGKSTLETKKIAIVLGPLLFALGLATTQLGWWNQAGGLALALAAVLFSTTQLSHALRWVCGGLVLFASAIGASFVFSGNDEQSLQTVDRTELETLMERHLAQWLALRGEDSGEVAFAPPNVSVSLAYFGGLRGLGTPYPENVEGFSVGVRLSAASTADEARALATGRELSLIVHPSWDPFLEEYARIGSNDPGNSFIAMLNRWQAPRWLEPVAYRLPNVKGFEDQWVTIFQSVEVQDNTSAIGRLVEYFLDSGRGSMASKAQNALETNFPDELVTHITASEVAMALGDRSAFTRSVDSIVQSLESGNDFYLTWEFRVSMTLMLANGNRIAEMKTQLERTLVEANLSAVRRLSTTTLGKLLHLAKALNQEFSDPELKQYALSLLPAELQEGL
ncbi:MAG: hypothetical protein ACI92G_000680 [Candidatus Pelagisphaera sp.]|jgi:hypothetical protein